MVEGGYGWLWVVMGDWGFVLMEGGFGYDGVLYGFLLLFLMFVVDEKSVIHCFFEILSGFFIVQEMIVLNNSNMYFILRKNT